LDGYCEEKKVAIEYQGYQHAVYPNHFHKTREEFEAQKIRDRKKYRLCAQNGIKLILVPHRFTYRNAKEMEDWLVDQFFLNKIVE
jgi:hypothetical protein